MSTNIKKYILQQAKVIDCCNYKNGEKFVDSLKWLAKNGKYFSKVDKELSKKLSKYCKIKECYKNCWVVLDEYPKLEYYQGYAKDKNGFVFEHTFLVKDNKVIDPTMCLDAKLGDHNVKGRFATKYFGVKFTLNQLHKIMVATEEFRNYIPELYAKKMMWK